MENEFEYLSDKRGHSGHFAEILFISRVITVTVLRFGCRY